MSKHSGITAIAVASSTEVRTALYEQLSNLEMIQLDGVYLELSECVRLLRERHIESQPDVLIIDFTGRELDACLMVQALMLEYPHQLTVIALHRQVEQDMILTMVRSGVKDVIHYPLEKDKLEHALLRHKEWLERYQQHQAALLKKQSQLIEQTNQETPNRIITVFSSKGGAGSTTLSVNLAYELSQLEKQSVLLLDMDQVFCNAASLMNAKPAYSLGELAGTPLEDLDDSLFERIIHQQDSGVDLIAGCKHVLESHNLISLELLEKLLRYLQTRYQTIVIDLPTHVLDPYHQFLVDAATEVLLVSSLDIPGLYRSKQYLDLARQHVPIEKIKLVLNRWELKAAYGMSNQALEQEFGYPVFARISNDWELNVEANSMGSFFSKLKPQSPLTKSIRQLASQLQHTANTPEPERVGSTHKGFLTLLFGGKLKNKEENPQNLKDAPSHVIQQA